MLESVTCLVPIRDGVIHSTTRLGLRMPLSCPLSHVFRLAVAVLVSILGVSSLRAQPIPTPDGKPKQPPYMNSPLKTAPELQVRVTCSIKQPSADQVVALLREKTGANLVLDPRVDSTRPALGSLGAHNTPAWILMEQLASSKIIQGTWEQDRGSYKLVSHVPPSTQEERKGEAQLEDQFRLTSKGRIYLFIGIAVLVSLNAFIWYRRRTHTSLTTQRSSEPLGASESPATEHSQSGLPQ